MSKYYDPNKPFSIANWNLLVRDINDLLQAPQGSCAPIYDTLASVMDPHKWSVDDIQQARDILKRTCPEISFSTPLRLWDSAVIQEIEAEMEKAWCDCDCKKGRQLIWQATGVVSDRNYTQQWIEVNDILGSSVVGGKNQQYRIEDVDHFNGWLRTMSEGQLDETGHINDSTHFPVEQPVIFIPRWIAPGSPAYNNLMEKAESEGKTAWIGEVTNSYYLHLVCP